MKKLFIVLGMLLAFTSMFAQEKPTVVIVPFDAKDVNQSEVDVISDVFLSEYASTGKAIVVDRGSFDKIKKEHQFQLSEWSDTTKVVQLGKALNAHQIITGQISKFGNQVVCTIKLIDVNTTEIISSSVKRVASVELLFDECIALSREIAIKAKIPGVYDIGDKGPGGGIVFLKDGDWRWEISDDIGKYNWNKAKEKTVNFNNNGFSDWRLPNLEEMTFVYNNLVKYGIILNIGTFWTSVLAKGDWAAYGGSDFYAFSFSSGNKISYNWSQSLSVRLIRKFNIKDTSAKKDEIIGTWVAKVPMNVIYEKEYSDECKTEYGIDSWREELSGILSVGETESKQVEITVVFLDDGSFVATYDYYIIDFSGLIGTRATGRGKATVSTIKYSKLESISKEKKKITGQWVVYDKSSDGKSYYSSTPECLSGTVDDLKINLNFAYINFKNEKKNSKNDYVNSYSRIQLTKILEN